jgi:hypothetical protein
LACLVALAAETKNKSVAHQKIENVKLQEEKKEKHYA